MPLSLIQSCFGNARSVGPEGDSALPELEASPITPLRALILVPLAILLAVTIVCGWTELDFYATGLFYSAEDREFPFYGTFVALLIYEYAPIPAVVLGVAALVVYFLGFWLRDLKPWRKQSQFFFLAVLIGPGLMVNMLLKPHWSRPRPVDTIEFGGRYCYIPPAMIGPYDDSKSFPSGHASMGFVLMAPAFLLYRRRRNLAIGIFALGILAGCGIGICRVAEGRHFLSDIVWAGGIVYFSCLAIHLAMRSWHRRRLRRSLRLIDGPQDQGPAGDAADQKPQRQEAARVIVRGQVA